MDGADAAMSSDLLPRCNEPPRRLRMVLRSFREARNTIPTNRAARPGNPLGRCHVRPAASFEEPRVRFEWASCVLAFLDVEFHE